MTETPNESTAPNLTQRDDFERVTSLVSAEFQTEEAFLEHNIPTYYLKQPQETKQAFLRLLGKLDAVNLIPVLRRDGRRVVLRVIPKPPVKPSNVMINWILFFATIGTTFFTGYLLSLGFVEDGLMPSPFVGGAAFTVAIMAVLGMHEMGHKLTANARGIDATPPYFIPGPPPIGEVLGIGTFGAVIMQKSLPPNKDALFDIGASGPIIGFILAVIVTVVGLVLSPVRPISGGEAFIPVPLIFEIFAIYLVNLPSGHYLLLHPVAFAGWVGMVVTMLNLLPAAMLDGGHVARSFFGEKARYVLTALSIMYLIIEGFWPMALFVLFISMYRHPGPLDDVSTLSESRKAMTIVLIIVFLLCSFPIIPLL